MINRSDAATLQLVRSLSIMLPVMYYYVEFLCVIVTVTALAFVCVCGVNTQNNVRMEQSHSL